jgi:molecular chaperone DnaK
VIGQNRYTATDITAEFLKFVKGHIAKAYNVTIDEAAFSYPVDFSAEARRELREAANRAGIKPLSFVSESTSAYLANKEECAAFSNVMVLDWGGGTLDISVLSLHFNEVKELAVSGKRIGGDDIDRALAERMHSHIAAKSGLAGVVAFEAMKPSEQDRLIACCENAKMNISDFSDEEDEYLFTVMDYGMFGTKTESLTTEQFNQIIEPIIQKEILPAIEEALKKANMPKESVGAVIVVGGSSNLRLYEYAIMNLFAGAKVIFPERRQWSTAEGAALTQLIGASAKLNEPLGVLLSDGTVFPIFESGAAAGDKRGPISFSLTEDVADAHFIFTDGSGMKTYKTLTVPTKGYFTEKLELYAELREEQTAEVSVVNRTMGDEFKTCEINKLTFFYDAKTLENVSYRWTS